MFCSLFFQFKARFYSKNKKQSEKRRLKNLYLKFVFTFILSLLFSYFEISFFYDILTIDSIVINLGFKIVNLSRDIPTIWFNLKYLYILFTFLAKVIILYNLLPNKKSRKIKKKTLHDNSLHIDLGQDLSSNEIVSISEKGLYQNMLITGAIGSGKTSSAMYPITRQLIAYKSSNLHEKLGMLILDVKGNYIYQVENYAKLYNREKDIIPIQISGEFNYNPLDNIALKPTVLANRLKTILLLFSPNNTESYWIDKSETVLAEAIKLCRLYNNGYVTFKEIHNLITNHDYYFEKINTLRNKFLKHKFNSDQSYDLLSALNFFEKEFYSLDSRTFNILKSEITRITSCFVSDSDVLKTFCPEKSKNNFPGFQSIIESGKIVILNMNINEYKNLSKIIATYLKLDFQTEVLRRLATNSTNIHPVAFISDEYSEYVSATDANFFSQSRESKCINIVSTQSYTSLLNALNNKYSVEVIVQNLVNKLWFRSDDMFTIEDAQKQLRKNRCRKNFKNHIRKCKGDILQLYHAFITIKKFQYFRKYKYLYTTRL